MARILISSTTEDLKEHRTAVFETLRNLGHEPVILENLSADAFKAPFDKSRSLIDSCDLFVGIIAWHYGFVPDRDNPQRRSFVELEHRYAWESKKPTLVFLTSDGATWPKWSIDSGEQGDAQERFRKEVQSRVTVSYFTTPADLAEKVAAAVQDWQSQRARHEGVKQAASAAPGVPSGIDPLELAWRLVVDFKAEPALLLHMDLQHLQEAVEKWAHESGAADLPPSRRYEEAQEQLRKRQTDLAPHPLWLAWMRATRTSLQPARESTDHA